MAKEPLTTPNVSTDPHPLSRRDYIATQLMCGYLAGGSTNLEVISERAIRVADDFILMLDRTPVDATPPPVSK